MPQPSHLSEKEIANSVGQFTSRLIIILDNDKLYDFSDLNEHLSMQVRQPEQRVSSPIIVNDIFLMP